MNNRTYCAVIRTLGTAGEKYQALLNSLVAQTLPPKRILVYIPNGYEAPRETVGIEQIVRCEKGMVTQRSLPFNEVDTDFILFCDDDMFLPPEMVERMLDEIERTSANSVVPDIYGGHRLGLMQRMAYYLSNSVSSRTDDGWALKVKRDAGYSFNQNPRFDFLPTQTGPGGCIFCETQAFRSIHLEDERWLDTFKFPSYEDQLFHYKMFLMGYTTLMYYNSGIRHLDARAGTRPDVSQKMYYKKKLLYVVWYRTIYNIASKSRSEKVRCALAFFFRNVIGLVMLLGETIRCRKPRFLVDYFRGLRDGRRYVHSDEYKKIPAFDAYL